MIVVAVAAVPPAPPLGDGRADHGPAAFRAARSDRRGRRPGAAGTAVRRRSWQSRGRRGTRGPPDPSVPDAARLTVPWLHGRRRGRRHAGPAARAGVPPPVRRRVRRRRRPGRPRPALSRRAPARRRAGRARGLLRSGGRRGVLRTASRHGATWNASTGSRCSGGRSCGRARSWCCAARTWSPSRCGGSWTAQQSVSGSRRSPSASRGGGDRRDARGDQALPRRHASGGVHGFVRDIPAARPLPEITSAIFRDASSIISSPIMAAPRFPPASDV